MIKKKRVLIFYDYFSPAYKAGGPIQSLHNLVHYMSEEIEFYILTSNQDHDGTILSIETDQWAYFLPNVYVWYASGQKRKFSQLKKIISDIKPDILYLNGLYSLVFVIYPLIAAKKLNIQTIIAPRGMLHPGALRLKSTKKKIFLHCFRLLISIYNKDIRWHATDVDEKKHVKSVFGNNVDSMVIGNVPKSIHEDLVKTPKSELSKKITFVSISLIAHKKNILQAVNAIKSIPTSKKIVFHIYGPIKEPAYFEKIDFESKNNRQPNIEIRYLGDLMPKQVPEVLSKYHFFLQPTFGENFGHSLFEAFSSGLPVITSDQTPWRNLQIQKAGWDVSIEAESELQNAINEAIKMDDEEYILWQKGAREFATKYLRDANLKSKYLDLFHNW